MLHTQVTLHASSVISLLGMEEPTGPRARAGTRPDVVVHHRIGPADAAEEPHLPTIKAAGTVVNATSAPS